jgi:hypothetical protein
MHTTCINLTVIILRYLTSEQRSYREITLTIQAMYNVTYRRFRETIVDVEKQ